jgi:ketosteroid isomerase-like protein
MSEENVEVVRGHYEAFERKNFDAAAEGGDPSGEWIPAIAGAIEGKAYLGFDGFRAYFDELLDSFSEVRLQNREFRDLGDRVLVLYDLRVRGHDSGVTMDQPIYTFRSGRIIQGVSYLSRAEALEAAGLRE